MRLSNFLLWQAAYAEIYVTKTLWPDFRDTHLVGGILRKQKARPLRRLERAPGLRAPTRIICRLTPTPNETRPDCSGADPLFCWWSGSRRRLWLFALAGPGLRWLAIHEYLGIMRVYGIEPLTRTAYIISAMVVLGSALCCG